MSNRSHRTHCLASTRVPGIVPGLLCMVVAAVPLGAQGDSIGPTAVNKPTLTYFSPLGGSVLFGGYTARGVPLGETWLLQDTCWRQLRVPGPAGRAGHGAAYDSRRGRLVVFGGAGVDGKPMDDTWEFDGSRWEQRDLQGPPPRMLLRMTYDERRGRVLLAGGTANVSGPHPREVWQWDGRAWTILGDSTPPPRFESAFVYDGTRGQAILFGGNRSTDRRFAEGTLSDTWVMRGNDWRAVDGNGPVRRDHHGMAFHAARGVALLFGGSSGGMLGDTWTFDGERWAEQREGDAPPPRGGVPAMTYDTDRRRVLMYGGWGSAGALTDLWSWDGRWSPLATSVCAPD